MGAFISQLLPPSPEPLPPSPEPLPPSFPTPEQAKEIAKRNRERQLKNAEERKRLVEEVTIKSFDKNLRSVIERDVPNQNNEYVVLGYSSEYEHVLKMYMEPKGWDVKFNMDEQLGPRYLCKPISNAKMNDGTDTVSVRTLPPYE